MTDFTFLTEDFVLIVLLACLIVGYAIKHGTLFKQIPNNDIPIILALLGGILNCFVSGFNIESIVYGALTGLASTGMHQSFKRFIENRTLEQ